MNRMALFDVLSNSVSTALMPLLEVAPVAGAGQQCEPISRAIDRRCRTVPRARFPSTIRLAPGPRRWLSCPRPDHPHRADCSWSGGTGPGWSVRSRLRGRLTDRSCRRRPSALRFDAIGGSRASVALLDAPTFSSGGVIGSFGAVHRLGAREARYLGDAVADVVHRVQAGSCHAAEGNTPHEPRARRRSPPCTFAPVTSSRPEDCT